MGEQAAVGERSRRVAHGVDEGLVGPTLLELRDDLIAEPWPRRIEASPQTRRSGVAHRWHPVAAAEKVNLHVSVEPYRLRTPPR